MQDPGAGRSDGERAGDRPCSDMPPIERQSAGPYSRRRIRAHSTPPRGVVRARHDVAQRVPAPVIRLTPADAPHVSATLLVAALEAVTTAGQRSTLGEVGAALVEGVTGALDLRSAYLYLLEEALTDPCLRLIAQTGEHAAFMSEVSPRSPSRPTSPSSGSSSRGPLTSTRTRTVSVSTWGVCAESGDGARRSGRKPRRSFHCSYAAV